MPKGQSEVKLVVKDLVDRGGVGFTYRVVVKPVGAAFQLALATSKSPFLAAVPRSSRCRSRAPATTGRSPSMYRRPGGGGVTVLPSNVPAGQTSGVVGLKAAAQEHIQRAGSAGRRKRRGWPDRRGIQDDRLRPANDLDTRLRHGRDDPQLTRPMASLTSAVTRPSPIILNPEASKVVVPQGGTVEVPLRVVRTIKRRRSTSSPP